MSARRAGALGLVAVAALWAAGFAWFASVAWAPTPPPPLADGIVALTGGADRVETALHLLAEHRAGILLISGVGGRVEFAELARRAGVDRALASRVTLGRAAASTRGNALETAEWARARGVRTLLVVTAGYHMPRAMAELTRAVPELRLFAVPVAPHGPEAAASFRLLASEYVKYLAVVVGLSNVMTPHSGQPA